jgi:DNA polymerase III subunit delta
LKYSNLRAFEKHLQAAAPDHFADIYVVLSKDHFERKSAINILVEKLLKGSKHTPFNLKTFDGGSSSIEDIIEDLCEMALFSGKRIILIEQADKLSKSATMELEAYYTRPNPSIHLIIIASAISHVTNFYKKAEKAGVILEFEEVKPWEKEKLLGDWIQSIVVKEKKSIDPPACQYLLKQVGVDQTTLHNELQKLFCYIGDRSTITLNDVGAICCSVNIENAWQLGDAIFRRDPASALRITQALLTDGIPFLVLIRQIRTQFQTKFQICSILANGGTSSDVAQQYAYMKGNILERNIQMAREYGMDRFKKGMLKIDETETKIKNSGVDETLLAELLIITITK